MSGNVQNYQSTASRAIWLTVGILILADLAIFIGSYAWPKNAPKVEVAYQPHSYLITGKITRMDSSLLSIKVAKLASATSSIVYEEKKVRIDGNTKFVQSVSNSKSLVFNSLKPGDLKLGSSVIVYTLVNPAGNLELPAYRVELLY